jgi:hypothetical protein
MMILKIQMNLKFLKILSFLDPEDPEASASS